MGPGARARQLLALSSRRLSPARSPAGDTPVEPAISWGYTTRSGQLGQGLLATAAGLTLRPLTGSVPAGQASAYRFQIIQAGGSPLTRSQTVVAPSECQSNRLEQAADLVHDGVTGGANGTQRPPPRVQEGEVALRSPMPRLALLACLAASLTACATTAPRHAGDAALATVHSPGRHAHTPEGCPLGRLLPPGTGIAIDYVDFLRSGGHMYVAAAQHIKAAELGRVITHVRCSLGAEEDQQHAEPPLINGTASFLAAGSAIYQVRGYAPSCRLAAYLRGRLQVYLAQTSVHHHAAAARCAVDRVSGGHPAG